MIRLARGLFLLVISISTATSVKAKISPGNFSSCFSSCCNDTILINGQTLSIRSSVEIDTLSSPPEKSDFNKWLAEAQFYSALRMGKEIGGESELGDGFFRVLDKTNYPEFSFEVTHPVKESFQLFYKTGSNLSVVNRLSYHKLDENVIGFNWDNSDELWQIFSIKDPLLNESDSLLVPFRNSVNLSVIAGLEWRGVMRGARGWVWGGQLEWSPVKVKRSYLFQAPTDPDVWDEVLAESTYEIVCSETNALKLRAYTSWSPWRIPLFLRAEFLLSIDSASSWVSIGYLW